MKLRPKYRHIEGIGIHVQSREKMYSNNVTMFLHTFLLSYRAFYYALNLFPTSIVFVLRGFLQENTLQVFTSFTQQFQEQIAVGGAPDLSMFTVSSTFVPVFLHWCFYSRIYFIWKCHFDYWMILICHN